MSSQGITTVELTQFQAWLEAMTTNPNILDFIEERYSLDGHVIWRENGLQLMNRIVEEIDSGLDEEEELIKMKQIDEILNSASSGDDGGESVEITSSQKTLIGAIEEKKLERIELPLLVSLRDQPLTNSNPHPRSIVEEGSMVDNGSNSGGNNGMLNDVDDPLIYFDDYEEPEYQCQEGVDIDCLSKKELSQVKSEFNNGNSFQQLFDPKLFSISRGYIYEDYEMKYNYPNVYLKPNSEWAIFPYLKNIVRSYIQLPYKVVCKTKNFQQVLSDEGIQLPLFYGNKEHFQHEIHTCHESENCAMKYMNETIWKSVYLKCLLEKCNLWNGVVYQLFPWKAFSHCKQSTVFDVSLPFVNTSINIARTNYYGTRFSDVYNIVYRLKENNVTAPIHQTCGYFSSRILGACAASLSDEKGLRLSSSLNKYQIIIVPMLSKSCNTIALYSKVRQVESKLKALGFRVFADLRYATKNVEKFFQWESKGVSLVVSIGKQELDGDMITIKGRNTLEKCTLTMEELYSERIGSLPDKEDVHLKNVILGRVQFIQANTLEELVNIYNNKFKQVLQSTDPKIRKKQQMEFNSKNITSSQFWHVIAPVHIDGQHLDTFHEKEEEFYKKTNAEFRGYIKFDEVADFNQHIVEKVPSVTSTLTCIITGKVANSWMFTSRY